MFLRKTMRYGDQPFHAGYLLFRRRELALITEEQDDDLQMAP